MDVHAQARSMLFNRGSVQFGSFKLKLHEKTPAAPLSPFFFNLRTRNNPKPGPLLSKDCELIATCIWKEILSSRIPFTAICGIPNAGTPIVQALERVVAKPRGFRVIPLTKVMTDAGRRIVPAPGFAYRQGERVFLIDDLITKADTKFESITSLGEQGCIVAGLAVLIDREQGGVQELQKRGYAVVSAFSTIQLFCEYHREGKIDQPKLDECIDYIRNN
jgi:uridine monophosphate synthetase